MREVVMSLLLEILVVLNCLLAIVWFFLETLPRG